MLTRRWTAFCCFSGAPRATPPINQNAIFTHAEMRASETRSLKTPSSPRVSCPRRGGGRPTARFEHGALARDNRYKRLKNHLRPIALTPVRFIGRRRVRRGAHGSAGSTRASAGIYRAVPVGRRSISLQGGCTSAVPPGKRRVKIPPI